MYVLSVLLCLLSAVFFFVAAKNGVYGGLLKTPVALILGGLAWNTFVKTGFISQPQVTYNILLAIAGITWFFIPGMYLLGLPFIILAFIEKKAGQPLAILVSKDGIVFDSLFKKSYAWTEFSNVIIKDGLLTLDFRSNRLLQKNIDSEIEEHSFNRYCRERLQAPAKPPASP